jgi:hypothetical protein
MPNGWRAARLQRARWCTELYREVEELRQEVARLRAIAGLRDPRAPVH